MSLIEKYILEELKNSIGEGNFQLPLFFDKPIKIGNNLFYGIEKQQELINSFFDTVILIAHQAVDASDDDIIKILFSDSISGMDIDFHRSLPDFGWQKPTMYRTDQSVTGKIFEIQVPGSGWGDHPLYAKALLRMGHSLPEYVISYNRAYAQNIIKATNVECPKVYHMLDAASAPTSMKYLFTQTRPLLKYWSLDDTVSMYNVDFVVAHSAASLVTCNFYNVYMKLAKEGKLKFCIPPNLLFDQKAIYLLPFHRRTSYLFTDEIRSIFPFTSFIENDGFYDSDGQFVRLCDFVKRKKSDRQYFLKYGGTDLSRNWGSRSVNRLSGSDCKVLLEKANNLSKKGEIWLLQEDVSNQFPINTSNDLTEIKNLGYHVKLSAFYGIEQLLGIKVMARKHFKVHGQADTYTGIGIL